MSDISNPASSGRLCLERLYALVPNNSLGRNVVVKVMEESGAPYFNAIALCGEGQEVRPIVLYHPWIRSWNV
jgi:hypothetical protein